MPTKDIVCAVETLDWEHEMRWGSVIQTFLEVENEALSDGVWPVQHIPRAQVEELENGAWRPDWEEMQANPLDGYSLFALYLESEPVADEDEWE